MWYCHKNSAVVWFNTLSLRKILRVPYNRYVTNATVRKTTGCPDVSSLAQWRRLRFSRHVTRANFTRDHHQVISAPLRHCRRPRRSPRTIWVSGIDADNIGVHSAWRNADDRALWRHIIDTGTLCHGAHHWRRKQNANVTIGASPSGVNAIVRADAVARCYHIQHDNAAAAAAATVLLLFMVAKDRRPATALFVCTNINNAS